MYLIALLVMIILYPFNYINDFSLAIILYWIVYFCQYFLLKRLYGKELLLLLVVIILNFVLSKSYIYFRFDIQLAICFTALTIYYIAKGTSKYRWQKILSVALIIPLAMSINFYLRKDKLIKDRAFEKCIKEELNESLGTDDITKSNLEKITFIYIGHMDHVSSLEGIENLKNLETLYLGYVKEVKNIDFIFSLQNLKKLSLDKVKLDNILNEGKFEAVEELEIDDFKISDDLLINEKFPALKKLEMKGTDLKDLSFIKELQTLESLDISFCEINSLDGIENLKNLKKLKFYNTKIADISKIKELKKLEEIDISKSEINNIDMLKNLSNVKRLNIK